MLILIYLVRVETVPRVVRRFNTIFVVRAILSNIYLAIRSLIRTIETALEGTFAWK